MPHDKGGASDAEGGWMPNYHVPTEYFIDWSRKSVADLKTRTLKDIKTRKGELRKIRNGDEKRIGSRFQNQSFYFRLGTSYSPTGEYSPTFRLGTGAVFGNKGSTIFSDEFKSELIMAFATSILSRYLLKNFLSHTVETGEEVLTRLPLPQMNETQAKELESLVASIIEKQKLEPRYAYWLDEGPQIDALVYALYGLDEAAIAEVERWYCRRYPRLARAQGVWDRVAADAGASAATSSE